MQKAVTCLSEGERTSLGKSAKLKPAVFRATNNIARETRLNVLRHFRRSYLQEAQLLLG